MKICKVKGCDKKYKARGYCAKHYAQMSRNGRILEQTIYDKNKFIDCGDYYEVCLYDKKCIEIARTKIDKDDLVKVQKHKWGLSCGYVMTTINKKAFFLHHLILERKNWLDIDHIKNKLDNRKENLRYATRSQNNMNRKNVKGYYWNKEKKKWMAYITINYKIINLGYFKTEEEAQKVRKQAELKYFGRFAFK